MSTPDPSSPPPFNTSLTLPPSPHPPHLQPRHIPPYANIAYLRAFETPLLILAVSLAGLALCTACIALSRLFTYILDHALSLWANSPPANQVVIEAGHLRMEFGCSNAPVPVAFVEEFAGSWLDAVERGFAPVFAREWWWERGEGEGEGGRVCYVGMRVVGEGGRVRAPGG